MRTHPLLLLILVVLTFSACKTKQPVRPVELYDEDNRFITKPSVIRIPINIDIAKLERSLNAQMTKPLYEDYDFYDGDRMKVKAVKAADVKIAVESSSVSYRVPVGVWMQYNLGVGTAEARGSLELNLKTNFTVGPDWKLSTVTSLEGHTWREKPRLNVGGVSVPIEGIANLMIRRSTATVGKSIDDAVAANFKLEEYIADAWRVMFKPYEVSPEYKTWLMVNPRDIGMTPIKVTNGQLASTVLVRSEPSLKFGDQPADAPLLQLPPFSYRYLNETAETGFQIYLDAVLPYREAEAITQQNLRGQRFEQGNKYVVVEDVELYGQGSNIVVNLLLSGSYRGRIYLVGEPAFDPVRNRIEVSKLDFTFDTKNILIRSAGWLAKGTLQKKLQESMDYLLDYNLQDAQRQMQEQLRDYELSPGIRMAGNLAELNLYNAYLTPEGIKVVMSIKGDLGVSVTGLGGY